MRTLYLLSALVLGLAATACAPAVTTSIAPTVRSPGATLQPAQTEQSSVPAGASADLVRTGTQGAVQFKVTPLNLVNPGESFDFEVDMNTHSVDLGMNLADLASLTTDNGRKVTAQKWEAPGGGHHVAGKLRFPTTVDGTPLLKGATKVMLSLKNIDAPERVFTWELK